MDRFEYPGERYELPAVHVSWFDAQKLCAQAGKRLCREDEWERACTMGRDWSYSYGPESVPQLCNADHPTPEMEAIAPAGSRFQCRNAWGTFDLNGNVSEWVDATDEAFGSTVGILRGGTAWPSKDYGGSCWSRHAHPLPDRGFGDDGFRCCADPGVSAKGGTSIVSDSKGSGQPDEWIEFDSQGRVVRFEKDRHGVGKPDWRDFYAYDSDLGRERMVRSEADTKKESFFDTQAFYNEKEELIRVEQDRNGDGKADKISYYVNASRPPYKIVRDDDFNGSFEIEETPPNP